MHKVMTEKQRHTWSAAVLVVGLSMLPMSVSLLAVTIYIRFVVDEELELVQGMNTATLPYFLAFTGTVNFLSGLLLLSAMARAHRPSSRAEAVKLIFMAILASLVASVFVFTACLYCFIQKALLPGIFQEGLSRAMRQYSTVPDVKVRLDLLQMEYECCGDSGYNDWFHIPWVPEGVLVAQSTEIRQHKTEDKRYTNDDVPFSCCNPTSFRPCIHHHVTTNHLHFNYDHHLNTTLYTAGCRQALMDFFGYSLLQPVALSLLFLFIMQMGVLAASRLLQTSMQNAINTGDTTATAVGYLLKPPRADLALQSDVEAGEKQALLAVGPQGGGHRAKTTDTEGETTDDSATTGSSTADETGSSQEYRASSDTEGSQPVTDEEPLYQNIAPLEEPIYENLYVDDNDLYDDIGEGADPNLAWRTGQSGNDGRHVPLFPSEMVSAGDENEGHHNSLRYARRRGSRAFNSLGIAPHSTEQ